MNALVYSSSLVAAFLGGILALFAPCCVVSLLPTFVATATERGRRRLPTTAIIFSAGVATVLLPIVLGVGALGQLVARYQRVVFLVIGIFLAFLGVSILWGRGWTLPMPSLRLRVGGSGPARVFTLGLASGVASSCCAPVVVGVVAMSALAASPLGAVGLAMAYVVGMVFPLFVAALFSDRLPKRWVRVATGSGGFVFRNRRIAWQDLVAAGMFLAVAAAAPSACHHGPDELHAGLADVMEPLGDGSGRRRRRGAARLADLHPGCRHRRARGVGRRASVPLLASGDLELDPCAPGSTSWRSQESRSV